MCKVNVVSFVLPAAANCLSSATQAHYTCSLYPFALFLSHCTFWQLHVSTLYIETNDVAAIAIHPSRAYDSSAPALVWGWGNSFLLLPRPPLLLLCCCGLLCFFSLLSGARCLGPFQRRINFKQFWWRKNITIKITYALPLHTHTHRYIYPPGLRLIDAEIACTALQQNGKWKAKLEWSPEQSGQSCLSVCLPCTWHVDFSHAMMINYIALATHTHTYTYTYTCLFKPMSHTHRERKALKSTASSLRAKLTA